LILNIFATWRKTDAMIQNYELLLSELKFQMTRSTGPGGQHVNKVNTRVELRFSVKDSQFLDDEQKNKIFEKLQNRINNRGELLVVSDITRSQLKNKQECIRKFIQLINDALTPESIRVPTKPTMGSKKVRLEAKKRISSKKQLRKKPGFDL
jgi:ribosome-associated protein